jgi:hypothetical protein
MNVSYAMVMGRVRIRAPTPCPATSAPATDCPAPDCPATSTAVRMPANVHATMEAVRIDVWPHSGGCFAFAPTAICWTTIGKRVKVNASIHQGQGPMHFLCCATILRLCVYLNLSVCV